MVPKYVIRWVDNYFHKEEKACILKSTTIRGCRRFMEITIAVIGYSQSDGTHACCARIFKDGSGSPTFSSKNYEAVEEDYKLLVNSWL